MSMSGPVLLHAHVGFNVSMINIGDNQLNCPSRVATISGQRTLNLPDSIFVALINLHAWKRPR